MIENFREVSSDKSVLGKQLFSSQDEFSRHLESYITADYDVIVVLKFREHLPQLTTIWQNFYLLESFQDLSLKLGNPNNKLEKRFRLVSFDNKDWYIEVLAVLGGLGGLAAVVQLIYTIIHDKKIETQQRVSKTRQVPKTVQRPTGSGQIQQQIVYQSHTFYETQTVSITTIGMREVKFATEAIAEYYEKELELIEVYFKDGRVKQVTIEELIKGTFSERDDEVSDE